MPFLQSFGSGSHRGFGKLTILNTFLEAQAAFTTCGTYTWVCPPGVTSVSVMCIGAGGDGANGGRVGSGGGGGGYAYIYDYPVTPGTAYTVQAGCGGGGGASNPSYSPSSGRFQTVGAAGIGDSYFNTVDTVRGGGGDNGISSGNNLSVDGVYGGGWYIAPGLTGAGRRGGWSDSAFWPSPVTGGGAGAGSTYTSGFESATTTGYGNTGDSAGSISTSPPIGVSSGGQGGGGMGIYGIGSTGSGPGGGGSGGEPGTTYTGTTGAIQGGNGGKYGGGGAGGHSYSGYSSVNRGLGADGAVRIIWGSGRAYPNTFTGNTSVLIER